MQPLRAYFSHHKCATKFVLSVLKLVCRDAGLRLANIHNAEQFAGDPAAYLREQRVDLLAFMNAQQTSVDAMPPLRGVHLVRDPRDVIVSGYFSHLHSHSTRDWPELVAHREKLQSLSKEDGLLLEMDFSAPYLRAMEDWDYGNVEMLELRFEELIEEPYKVLHRAFTHWGMLAEDAIRSDRFIPRIKTAVNRTWRNGQGPLPFRFANQLVSEARLREVAAQCGFDSKAAGRTPGVEDTTSHYRKGIHGDWKNHFNACHLDRFEQKFPGLLAKLGYTEEGFALSRSA